jgi:hypothetical protein
MGETNVTPKRMHQGGITLLALQMCIPLQRAPLIKTHYTTDKERTMQLRELLKKVLIQSEEGDRDSRSSWDVRVYVYRNFEWKGG